MRSFGSGHVLTSVCFCLACLDSVATAATAASLVSGTTASASASGSSTNAVPTAPSATPTHPSHGLSAASAPAPAPSSSLFSPPAPSTGTGGTGAANASAGANANTAQTLRSMLDTLRERLQRSSAASAASPAGTARPGSAFTDALPRPGTAGTAGALAHQASLLSSQHASLASELAQLNTQMQQITEQMSAAASRVSSSSAAAAAAAAAGTNGTGPGPGTANGRSAEESMREDLAGELTRRLLAAAGAGEAARRGLEEAERRIAELERSLLSRLAGSGANSTSSGNGIGVGVANGSPAPASEPDSDSSSNSNSNSNSPSAPASASVPRTGLSPPGQRAREILMDALAAAASHRATPVPSSSSAHRGAGQAQAEQEFPSALAALPAWTASRQAEPPLEGTFERFLWELQVDLRALLVGRGEMELRRERGGEDGGAEPQPEQAGIPQEGAGQAEGASALAAEEADVPPPTASDDASRAHLPTPVPHTVPGPGRAGMVITTSNGGTTQGGTENDGERLNWWRMYRFPARNVPAENAESARADNAGNTEPGNTAPAASTDEPRTPQRAERRLRPQAPEDETVIPVILVGLRSVTPGNPAPALFDFADAPSAPASPVDDRQPPQLTPTTAGSGLEPWTSRDRDDGASVGSGSSATGANAASAGNNGVWQRAARLWNRGPRSERGRSQPSQPPAEREPAPAGAVAVGGMDEAQGTRSYIIWVVGGHYPPNHPIITAPHLLTGQLDHDDLWALGELLGQVKPPTATREEIEKSGLQVIRVTDLKEWEESGRVASNCTERCLICLGDYEDEEGDDGDVRVLGCRHCFHKLCVDR
ncbi:hypothetical protein CALCODRAFT_130791 [Calocera cornea HHB12733]|uniref:RING-type domain-containing protein n=1 Tax=Calocera cornea HHB12733 TaxID=1353952 RepID=A0A165IB36_9BASI|nr:hypothetical protein CALCODRAFT_130791 [Calocera cornea HHB12733]